MLSGISRSVGGRCSSCSSISYFSSACRGIGISTRNGGSQSDSGLGTGCRLRGDRRPFVSCLTHSRSCRSFYVQARPPLSPSSGFQPTSTSTPLQQLHILSLQAPPRPILASRSFPSTATDNFFRQLSTTTNVCPSSSSSTFSRSKTTTLREKLRHFRYRFPLHSRSYSSATMAADLEWPAARVRKTFLEYFEQKGHTIGMR